MHTQLDRASVYEDVNPLVSGNPPLDAADYMRHLYNVYNAVRVLQSDVSGNPLFAASRGNTK